MTTKTEDAPKGMVIKIPAELKGVGEALEKFVSTIEVARDGVHGGKAVDFGEFEERVSKATALIEREGMKSLLEKLDVDAPRVRIGGRLFGRVVGIPGRTTRWAARLQ